MNLVGLSQGRAHMTSEIARLVACASSKTFLAEKGLEEVFDETYCCLCFALFNGRAKKSK